MNLGAYLNELLENMKPIATAKLVNLSNLGSNEIKLFNERWNAAPLERRRQVISRLEELAESNPELNFDSIFQTCLSDPDAVVRTKAVEGLVECEDFRLIDLLVRLLREDVDLSVRVAAATALGSFALLAEVNKLPSHYAARVEQNLLAAIDDSATDGEVRRRAIEAVAPLNLPRVKEIIAKAFHSGDLKTRASALYAMGRNCDPQWLSLLLAELSSSERELRFEAARACGELGEEEVVPSLIKLLNDQDLQVKLAAIAALGEIGGKEAKEALESYVEHPDYITRQAAEEALAVLEFYQGFLKFSV